MQGDETGRHSRRPRGKHELGGRGKKTTTTVRGKPFFRKTKQADKQTHASASPRERGGASHPRRPGSLVKEPGAEGGRGRTPLKGDEDAAAALLLKGLRAPHLLLPLKKRRVLVPSADLRQRQRLLPAVPGKRRRRRRGEAVARAPPSSSSPSLTQPLHKATTSGCQRRLRPFARGGGGNASRQPSPPIPEALEGRAEPRAAPVPRPSSPARPPPLPRGGQRGREAGGEVARRGRRGIAAPQWLIPLRRPWWAQ